MKQWFPARALVTLVVAVFVVSSPVLAQFRSGKMSWTGTSLNADKTVDGFYQSLPAGYATTSARYPLIIYLHGDESIEGTHEDILQNGIPKLINDGAFPETFKVAGENHSFIVIAPHYTLKNLDAAQLGEAINNIIRKYRVNTSRIYLTGMSRGGGYTWEYAGANLENATSLAAIVPIAGAIQPKQEIAAIIGDADLPVWATHNNEDYLVPASNTITYVDWVNERKPNPRAAITLFESTAHEGWTRTYDPASKEFKGKNIYEWMLQYTTSEAAPLPVTLTSYKAFRSAAAEVTLSWSIAGDAAGTSFTIERSDGQGSFTKIGAVPVDAGQLTFTFIDKTPALGDNYYRLSQTDADGSTTYFSTLKVSLDINGQPAVLLQPNPVSNEAILKITHSEQGPVTISVFNVAGMLVQQWIINKQTAFFQQSLTVASLSPGSYVLEVRGKTFKQSLQFIKR